MRDIENIDLERRDDISKDIFLERLIKMNRILIESWSSFQSLFSLNIIKWNIQSEVMNNKIVKMALNKTIF